MRIARKPTRTERAGGFPHPPAPEVLGMRDRELWDMVKKCILDAKFKGPKLQRYYFLRKATRERDLHKSLKLLPKECEKDLGSFIDLRLKSSNLKERPRITR